MAGIGTSTVLIVSAHFRSLKRLRTGIVRSILEYFRYSAKYSRVAATEWLIPHVIIPTLRTSLVERSKLNHVGGRLLADDNVWSARN